MFHTIASINEYIQSTDRVVFVRWSSDIAGDVRRGYSRNHQTGAQEAGLSVNPLTSDTFSGPAYIAQQIREYVYLAIGTGARPYVLTGEIAGYGADGEPVIVDAAIVGEISQAALDEAEHIGANEQTRRIMEYAKLYADRQATYGRDAYISLVAKGARVWVEDVRKVLG